MICLQSAYPINYEPVPKNMPELPEVETTCRGISPYLIGQIIVKTIIRQPKLRWAIPCELKKRAKGQKIEQITRRGKYLILNLSQGYIIIHLGMSGSLRIVSPSTPHKKHDHFEIHTTNDQCLRYTDPRRFGCVLWTDHDPQQHSLLRSLGPEPLTEDFSGSYLFAQSRNKKVAIKQLIMNSQIVVGVGNIYANEALFSSRIHPTRSASRISPERYETLAINIKKILAEAIKKGGTTLKDFSNAEGKPGYFQQTLQVYGRGNQPCVICNKTLKEIQVGQRATVYCPTCQR